MPLEVGKKALDFLVARSGNRRHLEGLWRGAAVELGGGEGAGGLWPQPGEGSGKLFRFTLTTNGVLLDDEVTDFCNREMHNVVLSLDGRREVHDFYRKHHRGEGSYDTVVPRFQRFVKQRGDREYYIRGTYTRRNTDFLKDILHMADLGFDKLSMEPVVTSRTARRPSGRRICR